MTLSPPISRSLALLLPSIGNVVFVAILLVLAVNASEGLLRDGDTGYHIKTGVNILATGTIPRSDPYSFITPRLKWTAHEWLSAVIMASIYQVLGLTGVAIFFAVLLALTHWLLYVLLRSKSDDILLCTLITIAATVTASSHWLARPHVFTMPLLMIWHYLLERFQRDGNTNIKYLPWIMLFWVNLHGGYILGLALLLIYLAGNLVYSLSQSPAIAQSYRARVRTLSFTTMATVAACAVNPVGLEIFWFPLRVTSDRFVMDWVTEFMSPNFHQALPFKYLFIGVIAVLAMSPRRLNIIDSMLLTLVSYMALYSVRHVSVFAIVVAPILLRQGNALIALLPRTFLRIYQARGQLFADLDSRLAGKFWPVVAILVLAVSTASGMFRVGFNDKVFPIAAVEFLKREQVTGNMFNNDEFGDYLIFRAWPQYQVFTDGRSDMYGEKHGSAYLNVANLQPGWKVILNRYDISWVFFPTKTALTAALIDQPDWQPIYTDKVATILVRNTEMHRHLIAKYPSVKVQLD